VTELRTISYGGGVQSTALVILAATRHPGFEAAMGGQVVTAIMANVGDDSENPATIRYVREVMTPWAAERGVAIVEIDPAPFPSGEPRTLLKHLYAYGGCQLCGVTSDDECSDDCPSRTTNRSASKDLPIPIKVQPINAPVSRSCTDRFKVKPISAWLADKGATVADPATVALGISTDEIERATGRSGKYQRVVYPLLDLRMNRSDCASSIAAAGLPVPAKSACWFCPFHRTTQWAEIRRDDPPLFDKVVALEEHLLLQRRRRGMTDVYISSRGGPLSELSQAQDRLFDVDGPDGCDSGHCFT